MSQLQFIQTDNIDATNRRPKPFANLQALSFFSGAMGLDLGLGQAGIKTILASEIDPVARETIQTNCPYIPLVGDIRNETAASIRKQAGLSAKSPIDLVVGGPPCQAFSTIGRRGGFNDVRGNVFLVFLNLLVDLSPHYIVLENVRGLLSASMPSPQTDNQTQKPIRGDALHHILAVLENAGYRITFNLYNAANFGTPQKRERLILMGVRDHAYNALPHLMPTHSEHARFNLPRWNTLRAAFAGLENIQHHYLQFPEKRLKYYRMLQPGQYWRHLPVPYQKEALGRAYDSGGGRTGFLRRLAWDEPSPTLVTSPTMPATDLAHPEENRPLSVEEYKRIQEFPDDWIICGRLVDQYRQLGNAVPVGLGRAIGNCIQNHFRGQIRVPPETFPFSRYRNTDEQSWNLIYLKNQKRAQQTQLEFSLA